MDKANAIRVFREVALQGGFAAAARGLGTSPPSVTRIIAELERELGLRLFTRSTRQVALTEEGETLLARAVPLVEDLETVLEEMRDLTSLPRGHLRVTSVVAFGQERIAPLVPGFLQRHPQITVDLHISNRTVDLIQEHVDLAIRVGGTDGLAASSLKSRRIFDQRLVFVATPEYLANYGEPEVLDDLAGHRIVKQISGNWGRRAILISGETRREISLPQDFVVNSPAAARNAILTGKALGLLTDYLAADHLSSGRLHHVLPDYATERQPIYAVFVHRSFMPAKLRVFIDYLVAELGPPVRL